MSKEKRSEPPAKQKAKSERKAMEEPRLGAFPPSLIPDATVSACECTGLLPAMPETAAEGQALSGLQSIFAPIVPEKEPKPSSPAP